MGVADPLPAAAGPKVDPATYVAQFRIWQLLPSNAESSFWWAGEGAYDPDWLDEENDPNDYPSTFHDYGYETDDDLDEDREAKDKETDATAAKRLAEFERLWPGKVKKGVYLHKIRFVETLLWKRDNQEAAQPSLIGKDPAIKSGARAGAKRKAPAKKPAPRKKRAPVVAPDANEEDEAEAEEEEEDYEAKDN